MKQKKIIEPTKNLNKTKNSHAKKMQTPKWKESKKKTSK